MKKKMWVWSFLHQEYKETSFQIKKEIHFQFLQTSPCCLGLRCEWYRLANFVRGILTNTFFTDLNISKFYVIVHKYSTCFSMKNFDLVWSWSKRQTICASRDRLKLTPVSKSKHLADNISTKSGWLYCYQLNVSTLIQALFQSALCAVLA